MSFGNAVPRAETKNSNAATNSVFFRPNRSETGPASRTPNAHPIRTHSTVFPLGSTSLNWAQMVVLAPSTWANQSYVWPQTHLPVVD